MTSEITDTDIEALNLKTTEELREIIKQKDSDIQKRDSDIKRLKKLLAENLFYKDDIIHMGINVSTLLPDDVEEFIQEYRKYPKELIKNEDIISLINCNANLNRPFNKIKDRTQMKELASFIEELNYPTFIVATEIKTDDKTI